MTAKRKTGRTTKSDPPCVSDQADGINELLIAWLKSPEGSVWANQIIEDATYPKKARKRKLEEARHSARHTAFSTYLGHLQSLPANHDLPEGFHSGWRKWLVRFEREEVAKLPAKDRSNDRSCKWVKRAWVTTGLNDSSDSQTGRFIYHDKRPGKDEHPVTVVLVHKKGHWIMPEWQKLAAKAHPFVRAFCGTLPSQSDKSAVLGKMNSAIDLEGKADSPEDELRDAALGFYAGLCGDIRKCLPDDLAQCIPFDQVAESAPLWKLLDAAIGFGRMLQRQEDFGDGTLERLLRYGVPQMQASPWREMIAELIKNYRAEESDEPTATSLLEWIGAERPYSDNDPIQFPDGQYNALRGIKWPRWKSDFSNVKRTK